MDEIEFIVTYRCDQEDYFCTESITLRAKAFSVVEFVQEKINELSLIESKNTIIMIERII